MSDAAVSPGLLTTNGKRPRAFELKFVVSDARALDVQSWAGDQLRPDPHGDPDLGGAYRVTTLYLDTPGLDVFHRFPPYHRRKLRLRGYGPGAVLFLEQKARRGDRVRKRRTPVAEIDLPRLGTAAPDGAWDGAWFHERLLEAGLQPAYQSGCLRSAFHGTSPDGPVRLTLDRQLTGLPNRDWRLLPGQGGLPLLPGQVVLELKFCTALPVQFKQLIEDLALTPGPFSKYRQAVRAWNADGAMPQVG